MSDEQRQARRAQIPGIRVRYESATGEKVEADARDLGRGGVFVATGRPFAVGKRIHVELVVPGDAIPIAAVGRVVWVREAADGNDKPAGMGVKFIDVDEGSLEVIGRVVGEREKTVMGVGIAPDPALLPPPPPPAPATSTREPTIQGVGAAAPPAVETPEPAAGAPAREPSVAIDLAPSKKKEVEPDPEPPPPPRAPQAPKARDPERERDTDPPKKKGGSGAMIWILLLLIAGAAVAAYVYRDRILAYLSPPADSGKK